MSSKPLRNARKAPRILYPANNNPHSNNAMTPSNLLEQEFVDEQTLFNNYGLLRSGKTHFDQIYWSIPRTERPSLSIFFDPKWYLVKYPDVASHDIDPFVHFCLFGLSEGRNPHPLIDIAYINSSLDAELLSLKALIELISADTISVSPYFSLPLYQQRFPKPAPHDSFLRHFLAAATNDTFIPCTFFDAGFYTQRYTDVPNSPKDAFLHFVGFGDQEARVPGPSFDPEWYLRTNKDVAHIGFPPLRHFLTQGQSEGRPPQGKQKYQTAMSRPNLTTHSSISIESLKSRSLYERIVEAINARRSAKTNAVNERDVLPEKVLNIQESIRSLRFSVPEKPIVSILIPMFNELRITVECLLSIMNSGIVCEYEVYVADDSSTDPDVWLLGNIPGLRYHRNEKNLNFLRNSNEAFRHLKAPYILFLNNDAQVCKGAIDKLVNALSNPSVGAVGPKILFPDGRLQEAGCSINLDASANMIGLFQNPSDPTYCFSRDVEYISGAALMIKRELIGDTLFSEDLAPAYCEDLDLCLRIRAGGHRVRYVADAEVVHHLSVSMSDQHKKMHNIVRNQDKILTKWRNEIAGDNVVRAICYYLPQFHPIKENDYWWGMGFTEWTNVSKAEPSYSGHYQPHLPADLGFYDLRVREVFVQQSKLIRRYGLGGLCMYYYNFGGTRFLGRPLDIILENPDIDFPFCLCWANENWSKRWDGGTRDLLLGQSYDENTMLALVRDVIKAASDSRYIRVGGRPLFLIYRPLLIPDLAEAVAFIRDTGLREGNLNFHLVFVESLESLEADISPVDLGFDASVEFPPHGIAVASRDEPEIYKEGWRGMRFDYEATVVNAVHRQSVPWPRYPGVFPSWDNTARQPLAGTSFDNCSPEVFQRYAEEQIRKSRNSFVGDQKLIFINAWNEWAEGAHLEPDRAFGHRWLEAIRNALENEGSL
jgi:GT2 family glycosyltransferase